MLFYRGEAPSDEAVDSTIAVLEGALAYPLHYGYCTVGTIDSLGPQADSAWQGRRVFAFHPHTTAFNAKPETLIPIPDTVDDRRAALFANTETAVNMVQDGAPLIGERVVVFGLGVVGLLTGAILARMPGVEVIGVDPIARRREIADELGMAQTLAPEDAAGLRDFDLVYELTGRPDVLSAAVGAAGYGGRIVVGSWYGSKSAPVIFGTHFHRNRIRIVSSQVSTIAPELSGRWEKARRYDLAWQMLAALPVDALITHVLPVQEAAEAFRLVDEEPERAIQVLIEY